MTAPKVAGGGAAPLASSPANRSEGCSPEHGVCSRDADTRHRVQPSLPLWAGLTPPYSTIVADPPWSVEWHAGIGEGRSGRQGLPYTTMSVADIAALPVADLAAKSAHLWLWTTHGFLWDARGVAEAWGFRFAYLLVWAKRGLGMGGRFRHSSEYLLFCERGPQLPVTNRRDIGTWFAWPSGAHSVKPAAFGDLVERVSPGPYVELFARAPRFGWDSWGKGHESQRAS